MRAFETLISNGNVEASSLVQRSADFVQLSQDQFANGLVYEVAIRYNQPQSQ